jgi:hypothetical protein
MTRRQAAAGETFEGVKAVYIHGEEGVAEVAEDVKEGIREMVSVNLLPRTLLQLVYGGHTFPTIKNIVTLRGEAQFFTLGEEKVKHLLTDTSPRTAVDNGYGLFPAVHAKRQCTRLNGTQALAAIFKECLLPSQLQQPTREAYFSSWRIVVAWDVAHEEVKALLPMSQDTLQAITQEMLMIGCLAGTIRNLWSAIEDRHRMYGYNPPLAMRMGDFSRSAKQSLQSRACHCAFCFQSGRTTYT